MRIETALRFRFFLLCRGIDNREETVIQTLYICA